MRPQVTSQAFTSPPPSLPGDRVEIHSGKRREGREHRSRTWVVIRAQPAVHYVSGAHTEEDFFLSGCSAGLTALFPHRSSFNFRLHLRCRSGRWLSFSDWGRHEY